MAAAEEPQTLLEQLIQQSGRSYEKLAADLDELARQDKIDGTISSKHLWRLARRERPHEPCRDGTRKLLETQWGRSFADLFANPQPGSDSPAQQTASQIHPRDLAAEAAQSSMQFLAWAEDDRVPPAVLEQVRDELQRISTDYVHAPLMPLFQDLVQLRDTATSLLKDRPHPGQSRELFGVAGTTCLLLAHASQNLGDSQSAGIQARTAWACAEQADHNDLRAWVLGTQALIAEWTPGRLHKAIEFAQRGQHYATSTDSRVRLAAIEARACARAGNSAQAVEAVIKAQRAREDGPELTDSLADYGGLLTFPRVKQLYYAGSTLCRAGEPEAAENTALQAIRTYETGPAEQRSYGDEALARIDVSVARLNTGQLDGAEQALAPVLALPPAQRIQQINAGLDQVRTILGNGKYTGTPAAAHLQEQISGFAPDPHERPLT